MNQIPLLAWIAIIVIVLITIAVNLLLVALLRSRGQMKELTRRMQTRPSNRMVQTFQQVKEAVRDPFRQEREQLGELSRLVSNLNEPPSSSTGLVKPPRKQPPPADQ